MKTLRKGMHDHSPHDEFSYHEVTDRACLVLETFERQVLEHPVVRTEPRLLEAAREASDALARFYNLAGELDADPAERGA